MSGNFCHGSSLVVAVSALLLVALQHVGNVGANNPNGKTPWALHNSNLQDHIRKWAQDPDGVARQYGPIGTWDLRNVTSLRNVFSFDEKFNDDISGWNVSQVTDFKNMFWGATKFDGYLGKWDVRKASDMECMFCGASSFTGKGLENWSDKLGNVEDMFKMFEGSNIQADLSGWRVESVSSFREMFMATPQYNQQLCWNISINARVVGMFNDSQACLDASCVTKTLIEEAGCSPAVSWLTMISATSALVVFTTTAGLMALGQWV